MFTLLGIAVSTEQREGTDLKCLDGLTGGTLFF